jgi:anti-sigma regulatory factor (Ser/Thr protein kinase)
MSLRRHTTGAASELRQIDDELETFVAETAPWLSSDARYRVRLGLHELIVNIREHAYGTEPGPIEVRWQATTDELRIVVTDRGSAFTGPTRRRLPEEPSLGGYGLPILAAVFDGVRYRRANGRNTWRLAVRHAAEEEAS